MQNNVIFLQLKVTYFFVFFLLMSATRFELQTNQICPLSGNSHVLKRSGEKGTGLGLMESETGKGSRLTSSMRHPKIGQVH
jgi:hypothetical protein